MGLTEWPPVRVHYRISRIVDWHQNNHPLRVRKESPRTRQPAIPLGLDLLFFLF